MIFIHVKYFYSNTTRMEQRIFGIVVTLFIIISSIISSIIAFQIKPLNKMSLFLILFVCLPYVALCFNWIGAYPRSNKGLSRKFLFIGTALATLLAISYVIYVHFNLDSDSEPIVKICGVENFICGWPLMFGIYVVPIFAEILFALWGGIMLKPTTPTNYVSLEIV